MKRNHSHLRGFRVDCRRFRKLSQFLIGSLLNLLKTLVKALLEAERLAMRRSRGGTCFTATIIKLSSIPKTAALLPPPATPGSISVTLHGSMTYPDAAAWNESSHSRCH